MSKKGFGKAALKALAERLAASKKVSKEEQLDIFQRVPNRTELRMKGLNITQRTGTPFARLVGYRLTPASLYTLVAVHARGSDGKLRKFVIPRERFERGDS
jgi:hypothetical protein